MTKQYSNGISYGLSESGVPPNIVLFGGTVPSNSMLFGGTVPLELFCHIAFRKHLMINVTNKIGITNLVVTIKPMAVTTKLVVSAYFYESCMQGLC